MKVVLLAGGKGTRFSEETVRKPKPLIEVGSDPILWHIMKIYSSFGFNDFVVCLGYKGEMIKDYFHSYYSRRSDVTIDLENNTAHYHKPASEPWKITLVDTGLDTLTGGRIKRIQPYIGNEPFMLTYGDGVGDVDISALVASHKAAGKAATLTAVQPSGRFGALSIDASNTITSFQEKPQGDGHWINGGFFVCEPSVFDLIDDDACIWERTPLETLANRNDLNAYKHNGFWHPMDKQHDQTVLTELYNSGEAPWVKLWA
jgi:glucose-1-phosphate cytidylyltransferase